MPALELPEHDIVCIRAPNPGPYTLTGTNSWIVGRGPGWLIDPGPALDEHLNALTAELERRGGLGGIALTHDHIDHSEAVPHLTARYADAPVAAAHGQVDVILGDCETFGPLETISTPGHAPDHLTFIAGKTGFTGDTVLGEGSVFIAPDPGALTSYLAALHRLRALNLELICPGHGPVVRDPNAKLDEYIAHRMDRERRVLEALAKGRRTADELLDEVWNDAPRALRQAAAVTLRAHLDKLA